MRKATGRKLQLWSHNGGAVNRDGQRVLKRMSWGPFLNSGSYEGAAPSRAPLNVSTTRHCSDFRVGCDIEYPNTKSKGTEKIQHIYIVQIPT
jgi:hypothetical protein